MSEVTFFQCGPPTSHECDIDGPGILMLRCKPYEVPDTEKNREKWGEHIEGGSATCSICGRSAFANAPWIGE